MDEKNTSLLTKYVGCSVIALLAIGVLGLVAGLYFLLSHTPEAGGLCLIASAAAFGFFLNAALRK